MKNIIQKKRGRPPIEIDKEKLETIAKMSATEQEIAWFFKCDRSQISRFIKREYDMDFRTFRKTHQVDLKYKIINKVVKFVNKDIDKGGRINNQLLMFTMKNLCGWKDRIETTNINNDKEDRPIINFGVEVKTIDVKPTEVNPDDTTL
jgi:hypothetical protein